MILDEEGHTDDAPKKGPLRWAIPLLVAAVLGYPLVRWIVNRNQNPAPAAQTTAGPAANTPEYYLNLSGRTPRNAAFQPFASG